MYSTTKKEVTDRTDNLKMYSTNEYVSTNSIISQEPTNFDLSIFEIKDGMVNLTKIGKHFKKDVRVWTRSKKVKDFIEKLNKVSGVQNLHTVENGQDERGTFGTEKVALKFAEYISTDFEIWANDKIHTLLQTGKVEMQSKPLVDTYITLSEEDRAIAFFEERKKTKQLQVNLEINQKELQHKQSIIIDLTQDVPTKEMRAKINEICRNNAQGAYGDRWVKLYKEFYYRHHIDLKKRAKNKGINRLDYVEQNGMLTDLYKLALEIFEK